ncbi:M20/M25/M40 family metallo-hydrolase [Terrilactibacillus sp. S3-3]|nr:M20/M25/M40 family metallo-hydrolase [Terrilactibacillus sp. S3-3]
MLDDFGGNPVIYAHFSAGENGDRTKTLLFYNHYDVQPPEPLEEWESEPFEPTIKNGVMFARGTADNKGALVQRLAAVKVLKELEDGLPCDVTLMIEGEEEIGSPHLEHCLRKYHDLFQADACIWEFGSMDEKERVVMDAGIKGMAYFELICFGADIDVHSSLGAYVDNAAWRLVQALASMKNANNEILVDGFYDGVIQPTEKERAIAFALPFDEQAIKKLYGLKRPLITSDPRDAMIFSRRR